MTDITTHHGHDARPLIDVVLPIYADVYAEPPYLEGPDDVADFADAWARHSTQTGFRVVLAHDGNGVIGFSCGHLLPSDTDWWHGTLQPLDQSFTDETGERTFAVIELAVLKPHRGRGVARRLHAHLVDQANAERAVLLVRPEPEAEPARRAYRNWGYTAVGQIRPGPTAPVYDAMFCSLNRADA